MLSTKDIGEFLIPSKQKLFLFSLFLILLVLGNAVFQVAFDENNPKPVFDVNSPIESVIVVMVIYFSAAPFMLFLVPVYILRIFGVYITTINFWIDIPYIYLLTCVLYQIIKGTKEAFWTIAGLSISLIVLMLVITPFELLDIFQIILIVAALICITVCIFLWMKEKQLRTKKK